MLLGRSNERIKEMKSAPVRMIAIDLDGTLLGADGQVGPRNIAALKAAQQAGITVVIATGRRHCYALQVVRKVGLPESTLLVSSNGAVVRTFGSELIERTHMTTHVAQWLCGHLSEFRNALIITFDKVQPNGEDERGALVLEEFEELHTSIDRWMVANEPYIQRVVPIESALDVDEPIQMMLTGSVERMRRAEARMLEHEWVVGVGETRAGAKIALNRTEYPARDLSIVDILPAGCSKGIALLNLAAERKIEASEIMAIGDNWNDLSMLDIAGYPVLMGNAPDDLQRIAEARGWHVTGPHHEDGVADAIERHLPVAP